MKKLSKRDYKKISKFYKNKKHTRKNALKTISRKFCSCVEKVKTKKKGEAIGICTKSVINRKGFKRGKFSCKRKPSIQLYKGGKRRKKRTRKKRGGIRLSFPGENLIFFNVDDNFRIFLDQWWNTIDENQREFIRNMNIEALEHLVNALRVIYQIEQIVNQQQQNGGSRTFTSIKDFIKVLYRAFDKSRKGNGNEKHAEFILLYNFIDLRTKQPTSVIFKVQLIGFRKNQNLTTTNVTLPSTQKILELNLKLKIIDTDAPQYKSHIGREQEIGMGTFLSSNHINQVPNFHTLPLKIKGVNDDEWWTLNFRDNWEIQNINANLPERLSEEHGHTINSAGRSQGNDENNEQPQQQQNQGGGRRKKKTRKRRRK